MRFQPVSVHAEFATFSSERKQLESDGHNDLVFAADQTDLGTTKLAFRAGVDGAVRHHCGELWHCVLQGLYRQTSVDGRATVCA